MTPRWILSRLIVVVVLGLILAWLAYAVLLPAYVSAEYRRELSLDHFTSQTGESVAGSADAVYFGLGSGFNARARAYTPSTSSKGMPNLFA